MKWTVTKCYSRGNVGATYLGSDYSFCNVGVKIGPKTLWDNLWEIEDGWKFSKEENGYIFENQHIDKDGNSWGRSEIVLTYLNFLTVYDYLDEWLEKGKRFSMDCSNNEIDIKDGIVSADEVIAGVENFIAYNVEEEVMEAVTRGITVGIEGELICNNPYASPEYLLEWGFDEEEFTITIEAPWEIGEGYEPFTDTLSIVKEEEDD